MVYVAKTKALISWAVTSQLNCAFVFAYAKIRFSHDVAHINSSSLLFSVKCKPGFRCKGNYSKFCLQIIILLQIYPISKRKAFTGTRLMRLANGQAHFHQVKFKLHYSALKYIILTYKSVFQGDVRIHVIFFWHE